MADGDVCVTQVGDDWVVTIDGQEGKQLAYESLRDAVEAARRAALSQGSELRIDLGAVVAARDRSERSASPST